MSRRVPARKVTVTDLFLVNCPEQVQREQREMKRVSRLMTLAALFFAVGCDPGFTVRQANLHPKHNSNPPSFHRVNIEVEKFHTLVGSRHYTARAQVTNLSDTPISVDGVELVTHKATYASHTPQTGSYPVKIAPQATVEIAAWFELPEGIRATFKKPAELRVHYMIGSSNEIASASLIGKVQAGDTP